MKAEVRVVYNRPDCPYDCGEPLAPKLRWQGTPCPRCGRPLYPLSEVVDDGGQVLWPAAHVPRPPEAGLPGVHIWYVVRKEDAEEGIEIGNAEIRSRVDRSGERSCSLILIGMTIAVALVAAALAYILLLAPR